MDQAAFTEVRNHIARDERLLWAGKPRAWRYALVRSGTGVCIGAALALGIAIMLILGLLGLDPPAQVVPQDGTWRTVLAALAGLSLVVGVALASRVLARFQEAENIVYGLTDRRVVTIIAGSRSRIYETATADLAHGAFAISRHGDGSFTISLSTKADCQSGNAGLDRQIFVGIGDGERLERELQALARTHAAPHA